MNHKDYREQARLLKIEDDEVYLQRLATLPPDTPMLMVPRMSHVAEVKCPERKANAERIAAIPERRKQETLRWMEEHTDRYVPGILGQKEQDPAEQHERSAPIFLKEHVALLQHLKEHPHMGITEHYVALRWKPASGDRVKKKLEAEQLVEVTGSIPTKGRYKIVYALTPKGEEFLRHAKR